MTSYGDSETNTYFYIRNYNNSVVALVDEAGAIAESYTYTAYGEVSVFDANGNEIDESALGNRYTFQGREIDYTTGLYNFRARWYDAETGRWLSKDPIGIQGGLNQYVFCGNNPVMFVDPEGTEVYVFKEGLNSHLGLIIVDSSGVAIEYSFIADPADSFIKVVTGMKGIVTDMAVNLEDERFAQIINLHFTVEEECLLRSAVKNIKLDYYAYFHSNCTSQIIQWLVASGYLSTTEAVLLDFDLVNTPLDMYNYLKLRTLIIK